MKSTIYSLGLICVFMLCSFVAEAKTSCVVIFERKGSRVSQGTVDLFRGYRNVEYFREATPAQFLKCLEGDYDDVVVVAHTLRNIQDGREVYKLGYFVRQPDGYQVRVVLSKMFEAALEKIRDREARGLKVPKRLRLMVCAPKMVLASYPYLRMIPWQTRTKLDFAPVSKFLSMFHGESVVPFNEDWLRLSIR